MNEVTVQEAHKNHESIVQIIKEVTQRWLFLGKLLYDNKNNDYWKELGYESFREYLATPEFGYRQAALYRFTELYETYCLKLGYKLEQLSEVPYERLYIIRDRVKESDAGEWIEKAKTLSQSDLELEVREVEANKGHKDKKLMPKIFRHSICGLWLIDIDPNDMCVCYLKEQGL